MEKKSARTGLRRAVSLVLALVMALSVSLLPAAAVTPQDIANLKSKAQSLNSQKAQIQSQINSLANSKSNAMQKKQLLEQKIGAEDQRPAGPDRGLGADHFLSDRPDRAEGEGAG